MTGAAVTLLSLIQGLGGNYASCPGSSRSYNWQCDPANGANVLVGDENVAISPQQCGLNMAPGVGFLDRASTPAMTPLGSVYVLAVSGSQKLNVWVAAE